MGPQGLFYVAPGTPLRKCFKCGAAVYYTLSRTGKALAIDCTEKPGKYGDQIHPPDKVYAGRGPVHQCPTPSSSSPTGSSAA
jgi:hypothetical protein